MLTRFSETAQRAVVVGQEEARRRGRDVGPEHLLLGVARVPDGMAARVLAQLGVEAAAIEARLPPPGEGAGAESRGRFSPEGKSVLEAAHRHCRELGCTYIGTEHLLLALATEESGGRAFSVLQDLGADPQSVYDQVVARVPPRRRLPGVEEARLKTRDHVVSVRLDDKTLRAVDALVQAKVALSRSEAVYLLCNLGVASQRPLFEQLESKVAAMAEIQEEMRRVLREHLEQLGEEERET